MHIHQEKLTNKLSPCFQSFSPPLRVPNFTYTKEP
uniref:Uncharacterized protein n=1 Tax=Arundo donax TaxID=35708 RepID=A0A0A9G7M6_ARUDO